MKRKSLAARLVVAAAASSLALTACSSGGGDASAKGPVTLKMSIFSSNKDHLALLNGIAADYTRQHPDVRVEFDSIPAASYTTTLTTQIAGGTNPDLAWILEASAPDFVSSGALAPLTKTLQGTAGYQYDDLSPSATKLWTRDGDLYAYPFSTSPFGVFVNDDLFARAGQKTPRQLMAAGQWNWDTLATEASAIAKATSKQGMVIRDFDYQDWTNLATLWGGWGASAWSADGKQCGFDSPGMVSAMTFLHKAVFTDHALPGPGTSADFFAGDAAMTITQISRASLLTKSFTWDLVPLPAGPSGTYSVIGQAGIGVFKKSKHVSDAEQFLAFMTDPQNSAKLSQYFPPPRTTQLTAASLARSNPLLSQSQLEDVVISGIKTGVVKPSHSDSAEIAQTVRAALDPLWKADANVSGLLSSVCGKLQPLLAK